MIILSLPLTVAIGRYGILPLLVIGASFHARRIYQDNKRLGILVIIKMLLGIGLLLISALTALVKPTIWWVHWIGSTSFHFSILFSYFAIDQYINNKFDLEIIRNRLFIGLVILSLFRIYLEFERRNNLYSFMENEVPSPTFNYYISTLLHYLPALYLNAIIANLYWVNIRKAKLTPSYFIRRLFCLCGFVMATFAFISLTATIPLAIFFTDQYRPYLNNVYHLGKPIILLFLMAGMTFPNRLFKAIAWPIEKFLIWRDREQYKLLIYLMDSYNTIIPSQQYRSRIKRSADYVMPVKRINASIGDGRLLVLSHLALHDPNPQKEAEYIFHLLRDQVVIQTPGSFQPPQSPHDITKYNIKVAKRLKALINANQGILEFHQVSDKVNQ
ncbi:hypothetical protein Haur_5256 (plasmid) [Herpetosiphon aurantiacus DSM 785]|uniref:Uncharacterized protein n=1 Tax=Herpetosiphon aurantiacus (strain ATCC 23779 / DSM 785 / 114-95) TaxID=316274 RepID=A9B969_HERA2|nr:hypothetical protein Haur_5256 [Herpetosiphon aurantiacus DSM 785]